MKLYVVRANRKHFNANWSLDGNVLTANVAPKHHDIDKRDREALYLKLVQAGYSSWFVRRNVRIVPFSGIYPVFTATIENFLDKPKARSVNVALMGRGGYEVSQVRIEKEL